MPKKIGPEARTRAPRLVSNHLGEYPALTAVPAAIAQQIGVGHKTLSPDIADPD